MHFSTDLAKIVYNQIHMVVWIIRSTTAVSSLIRSIR